MKLPIHLYTLALDAIRFLPRQLEIFEKLQRPWVWHIISGVADNVLDTNWCAKITPRLSRDGTDEWLTSKLRHPNIRVYRRQLWPGKNAMVNAALSQINEPCCLMQVDADEFWTAEQLEKICELFETGEYDRMRFFCRYWLGGGIIATGENVWSNQPGEWSRAWIFKPGQMSKSHEPPVLSGCGSRELTRDQTRELGLVFEHEAYKYIEQLEFKQSYYKYTGAVDGWKRLQAHTQFPTKLKPFFHWVDDAVKADKL